MSWNHRVVRHVSPINSEVYYSIHEVYYGQNDRVESLTVNGIEPRGETEAELKAELGQMLKAFNKPTLDSKGNPVVEV